ncbi:hypothetical protein [Kribbella deserti]|uniref:Uncharacterized protein n=1 Tax=Kribbella deserti TaxID=1926257 RepID=A0ABV6QHS6_9ACTN
MKPGSGLVTVLAAVTAGLVLALIWWRAKREGRDEFWTRVERAGWVAAIFFGASTLIASVIEPEPDTRQSPAPTVATSTPTPFHTDAFHTGAIDSGPSHADAVHSGAFQRCHADFSAAHQHPATGGHPCADRVEARAGSRGP